MRMLLSTFILVFGMNAQAELQFFAGGGLGYNSSDVAVGSAQANYRGYNYLIEAGWMYKWETSSFISLSAESGEASLQNTLSSTTSMEKYANSYYAGKLGFYFNNIGVGFGQRTNKITITSLSTAGTYYESTFKGNDPFPFLAINFNSGKAAMTSIEAQYHSGTYESMDSKEWTLQIKLLIIPGALFGGSVFGSGDWGSQ